MTQNSETNNFYNAIIFQVDIVLSKSRFNNIFIQRTERYQLNWFYQRQFFSIKLLLFLQVYDNQYYVILNYTQGPIYITDCYKLVNFEIIYQKKPINNIYLSKVSRINILYFIYFFNVIFSPLIGIIIWPNNSKNKASQMSILVESPNVNFSEDYIESLYTQKFNCYDVLSKKVRVESKDYKFRTQRNTGKVGLLMVGFGGNNGSTILGGLIANKKKITWYTKKGQQNATMYGSMTQCSTMKVAETENSQVYLPIKQFLPLIDPTELVIGGWDINSMDMAEAMKRAQVFDYDLQQKLIPQMRRFKPMKSIYYSDFIAANQTERADNVLQGNNKNKLAHLKQIREDISNFKNENHLDKVVILWTANTERFAIMSSVHETYYAFMEGIKNDHPEISPSMIFALAAMQENCVFINGSPQNTLCPGLTNVPGSKGILIGNDFKTGQTKFKTAFMEFLTGAGIKPKSCVSYNHLGNNDGKNLSSEKQFKSKQNSKSECIKDILENSHLYKDSSQYPDHTVVIKYVPQSGDSKKAIDEYSSEIFMGGSHTFVSYNVCEDSLLAAGIIIDLIVLGELMTRISYRKQGHEWERIQGIVAFLGYLMKAPQSKGPIINSLNRQRACIENLIRILTGLPIQDHLLLNYRL